MQSMSLLPMKAIVRSALLCLVVAAPGLTQAKDLKTFQQDPQPLDRTRQNPVTSYAPILQEAREAVVSVTPARIVRFVRSPSRNMRDELLRRFFGLPNQQRDEAEVQERLQPQGVGSGVIISPDGYILTNNHVVATQDGRDADEIIVQLNDGRDLPAELIGRDPTTDIAVLKVEATALPYLPIAESEQVEVGDVVFALGNPLGVGLTVTQGIVSATSRSIGIYGREGFEDFIQTDASINPGNSGGALIDAEGRLVGVNSAILSQSGGSIGIGFAIPSDLAVTVAEQLINYGMVRRGLLGVRMRDLNSDMAEAFGLDRPLGALIEEVVAGSPAEEAGILRGDVITAYNDEAVENVNDLRINLAQTEPGQPITLGILRDGVDLELELSLAPRESLTAGGSMNLFPGVEVASLSEQDRAQYGIPESVNGVIIRSLEPVSPLARRLSEGMVIAEINDSPARTPSQARQLLRNGINKVYVYYQGRFGYITVRT